MISAKSLAAFRQRALNPNDPVTRGTAQKSGRIFPGSGIWPILLRGCSRHRSPLYGRNIRTGQDVPICPSIYYGDEKAERIIIAMGSVCDTIRETVEHLNAKGEKVGMIAVHLYRPFL